MNKNIIFIILILILSSFTVVGDLDDSLTNVYKFENTSFYNDVTGTTGTNSGVDFSTAGKDGQAGDFELNEVDYAYVTLASTTTDNKGSISCWFKPETFSVSYVAIGTQNAGTRTAPRIGIISGVWDAVFYDGDVTVNGGTPDGNWHNVIAVLDGLNKRLYVDGVSIDNLTSANLGFINTDIAFGTWDASDDNWDGLIDECYFWDISLDEPDGSTYNTSLITELQTKFYNSTTNSFYPVDSTVNDSVESTAIVKQIGTVTINNPAFATVFSSDFNITLNNTDLYGAYSFNALSTLTPTLFCELLIDGSVVGNVTRTQVPNVLGSVFLQSPVFTLETGTHNQELRCRRSAGGGSIDITNSVGIGHILVNEAGQEIPHSNRTISDTTSSASYELIDEFDFTISNRTVGGDDDILHHLVIDWALTYENNAGARELLDTYISINGTNYSFYPRSVGAGGAGSVTGDALIFNATENATYNIKFYGKGSNAEFSGALVAKEFALSSEEIAGGTGFPVPFNFSGDTNTLLFQINDSGNLNHGLTNVFEKVSFSISATASTEAVFYVKLVDSTNFTTINFTRTIDSNVGVLSGHDVLQSIPQDTYVSELYANCGTAGITCTISGGDGIGYITDVTSTVSNSFNIEVFDNYDNSPILNFSAVDGATFSTTNGNLTYFYSNETLVNFTITSEYNGGYFNYSVTNHNVSNDLTIYLNQSQIQFQCVTTRGEIVNCENSSTYYFTAGTYNLTFPAYYNSTLSYYNITQEITVNALDNKTINITGFYNQKVRIFDDITNVEQTDLTCTHGTDTYTTQPMNLDTYGETNLTCEKIYYYPENEWTLNETLGDTNLTIEEYKFKAYFSETIDWTITDVNNVTSGSNSSIILKQSSFPTGTVILRWNNDTQNMEWNNQWDETISVYLLVYNESMPVSKLIRVKEDGALSDKARVTVEYHDGTIWRVIQGKLTNAEGEAIVNLPNNHDFRVTVQKTGFTPVQDTFSTGSDNDIAKVIELTSASDKDDYYNTNCDNSFINGSICYYNIICGNACSLVSIEYNILYSSGTWSNGTSTYVTSTGNNFEINTTNVEYINVIAKIDGDQVGNSTANSFDLSDKDMEQILDKSDITTSTTSVRAWTIFILIFGAIIGALFEKKVMKNSGIYTQAGIYILSGIFIPVMLAYGSIIGIIKIGVIITKKVFSQ